MTFYTHWREVPAAARRWPNFSPAEIACRGTGKLLVDEAALDGLQAPRMRLGNPLIVRSAYRSPEHNRSVGGAKLRALGLHPHRSRTDGELGRAVPEARDRVRCRDAANARGAGGEPNADG